MTKARIALYIAVGAYFGSVSSAWTENALDGRWGYVAANTGLMVTAVLIGVWMVRQDVREGSIVRALRHEWREVFPNRKRNRCGVRYWQCDDCDTRKIDDPTSGGYRGGKAVEDHWLATGEWLEMAPPSRRPSPSAGQQHNGA